MAKRDIPNLVLKTIAGITSFGLPGAYEFRQIYCGLTALRCGDGRYCGEWELIAA